MPRMASRILTMFSCEGHAPGRAVFVEEDGQVLLGGGARVRRAHARFHEPLAEVVQPLGARDSQDGLRRAEALAGRDVLLPMAELAVRKAAADGEVFVPAVDLHLPGGRVRDLRAPEDVVLHVLHRQEREVVVHWHGADLAEALAPDGAHRPGGFELQLLQRLGQQAALLAPAGLQAVHPQLARAVPRQVRRDLFQREAGEQQQRPGRVPAVPILAERADEAVAFLPGECVQHLVARGRPRAGSRCGSGRPRASAPGPAWRMRRVLSPLRSVLPMA